MFLLSNSKTSFGYYFSSATKHIPITTINPVHIAKTWVGIMSTPRLKKNPVVADVSNIATEMPKKSRVVIYKT